MNNSVADNHLDAIGVLCSPTVIPIPLAEQDIPSSAEHNNVDIPAESSTTPHVEEPRTSTRVSKPPIWLKVYVRNGRVSFASCCKYPILEVTGYEVISPKYQSYLASFSVEVEPTIYSEAVKDKRWVEAM